MRLAPAFASVAALAGAVALLAACAGAHREPHAPVAAASAMPPAGLAPAQVPQLVCFGSDDNGVSGLEGSGATGGMAFLTSLFAGRRNPAGTGNAATFDGAPARFSFYVNTYYIDPGDAAPAYAAAGRDDPRWVRLAWRQALDAGHEIGVHTHSHPHGRELSAAEWALEMRHCVDVLARPPAGADGAPPSDEAVGLGLARADLPGFRTPYLEYADATLAAARAEGFVYDCSIEEGTQDDQDGTDFLWPYRLDAGAPADPRIGSHPGLWEVPVYVYVVPPDDACERLGVPRGLRADLRRRRDYFDAESGKVTGMDWNLWCEFGMSPAEFLATLRYTLELRLAGNRCPLTVGLHSELYSSRQDTGECATPVAARQAAVAAFFDHVLAMPDARVVTARDLVAWMERPVALGK